MSKSGPKCELCEKPTKWVWMINSGYWYCESCKIEINDEWQKKCPHDQGEVAKGTRLVCKKCARVRWASDSTSPIAGSTCPSCKATGSIKPFKYTPKFGAKEVDCTHCEKCGKVFQ